MVKPLVVGGEGRKVDGGQLLQTGLGVFGSLSVRLPLGAELLAAVVGDVISGGVSGQLVLGHCGRLRAELAGRGA
jgi:hypothetical protein